MALKGKGRVVRISGNKIGIYIPVKLHSDPTFPFRPRQDVRVRIEKKRLIIE